MNSYAPFQALVSFFRKATVMHRTTETTPKTISPPPRIVTRLAVGAVAATAAIIGGQLAISPSAYASTTQDTVMVKTQRMTSDTLNSKQVGWYPKGKHLSLICYERGESVKGWGSSGIPGGWDNIWYKVSDGYWVGDVDLLTGSNNPITSECSKPKPPAAPAKHYNAGIIAASNHYGNGAYGGQCLAFALTLVRAAGGPSLAFGLDVATYQSQWAQHATQISWSQAAPGDIIQWYDPHGTYSSVHTTVLASGNSASSARVVDSNYGIPLNEEHVSRGTFASRNIGFHAGTYKIWRIK